MEPIEDTASDDRHLATHAKGAAQALVDVATIARGLLGENGQRYSLVFSADADEGAIHRTMSMAFGPDGRSTSMSFSLGDHRETIADFYQATSGLEGGYWIKCLVHGDADGRVRAIYEFVDDTRWEWNPTEDATMEHFLADVQPSLT